MTFCGVQLHVGGTHGAFETSVWEAAREPAICEEGKVFLCSGKNPRPLLTSKEGLESIVDPAFFSFPFDSLAKVAAIASICVQPEASHRPFMGELVQAFQLVCNECDETKERGSLLFFFLFPI